MSKPTIPEVIERFYAYYLKNITWGSLHIVLDDNNVNDSHVEHCITWANEQGDTEGKALAEILLTMSKTQRLKIPLQCNTMMRERGDYFENEVKWRLNT